jgi:hypothetical protein
MLTQDQIIAIVDEVRRDSRVQAILLAGSYVYGSPTDESDLDVRCVTADGSDWAEFDRRRFNTRIEIFFNPPHKIRDYFEQCRARNEPDCLHFWANGTLVYDSNGIGRALQKEARELLTKGPLAGRWEPSGKYIIE